MEELTQKNKRIRNVVYRVGHRGTFLLFLAIFDFLFGYSLYTEPGPAASLNFFFPLHIWGIVWIVAGTILLSGVAVRRDYVQFTAATLIKAIWAVLYIRA